MVKNIIINVAVVLLLAINVIGIVRGGVNILNTMAIVICCICLALNFVDRAKEEKEEQ